MTAFRQKHVKKATAVLTTMTPTGNEKFDNVGFFVAVPSVVKLSDCCAKANKKDQLEKSINGVIQRVRWWHARESRC
jgi:hypothetical protein